jgi:peptidyl-prolyl cis-trans isomerase SurA
MVLLGSVLLFAACGGGAASTGSESDETSAADPIVVATYGDTTLTLSEFERAYADENQNTNPTADSLKAYQDFLEQYVNFRLKLRTAREAGMDTLPSIQREVTNYRDKMAQPMLMQSEVYGPLVRTLYERRQQEVDVSHIHVEVSPDAPPADTLAAYRKMQSIADSLNRGVPFGDLAYRNSDDPTAQRKGTRGYRGRLGYVKAGQLVEPFEERMYTLPPDSTSGIFRTKYGYHLLKVHDRRPAKPPIRLAHIMLRRTPDSARAYQTLDSLRTAVVEKKASFDTLATQFSEHRQSARKGGDLGIVENRESLPPSFQQALPRLDSVGAVSNVLETKFGYHLLQLTERKDPPSFEEAYDDLKETISNRPRVDRKKETFAREVRTEEGTTVDTSRILQAAGVSSVDSLSRSLLSVVRQDSTAHVPVATLGDSTYTLAQLAQHVMQADGGAQLSIGEVTEEFLNEKAFQYAAARLEERDASFAAQMKEYREGLLVFQFMQDSIWNVAAEDTAALRQTYQDNRDRYQYPERVRALSFRAPADSLLAPYHQAYTDTSALPPLTKRASADSLVTLDTVTVTNQSAEVYKQILSVEDGAAIGPLGDGGESLYLVRDTLLPARTKPFEKARSSVLQDYRRQYQEEVIDRLRRRYDVTTHPDRLREAFSETAADASSS